MRSHFSKITLSITSVCQPEAVNVPVFSTNSNFEYEVSDLKITQIIGLVELGMDGYAWTPSYLALARLDPTRGRRHRCLEPSALPLVRLPVRLLAGATAVSCHSAHGALLQRHACHSTRPAELSPPRGSRRLRVGCCCCCSCCWGGEAGGCGGGEGRVKDAVAYIGGSGSGRSACIGGSSRSADPIADSPDVARKRLQQA